MRELMGLCLPTGWNRWYRFTLEDIVSSAGINWIPVVFVLHAWFLNCQL